MFSESLQNFSSNFAKNETDRQKTKTSMVKAINDERKAKKSAMQLQLSRKK